LNLCLAFSLDLAAIAVDYALSMSYRDSRQRLQRMTKAPS